MDQNWNTLKNITTSIEKNNRKQPIQAPLFS